MWLVWLLISVAFFSVGEYYSKVFAETGLKRYIMLIVSLYAMGSLTWLPAIRDTKTLVITGTIWTLLSAMATLFIGLWIFNETLTTIQIVGMIFAMIGIILLML